MPSSTQFTAVRSNPEDEATSVEMLSIRSPSREASRAASFDSTEPTLRQNGEVPHGGQASKSPMPRRLRFNRLPSRFPWKIFFVCAGLPVALAPIVILSTAAEDASQRYIYGRDCYPNGLWQEAHGATWRIMDSSYFFTPNLSFGAMTFTQVKIIDIAWDLLVGRGGQLLLGWVNYRVFNEWLVYHMEMHATSYKMYAAVAFETTSVATLGVLGKEWLAFGERSWKRFFRGLALLCMLISTLYVLAFPTLMSAMTGYITTYGAYVEDYDHNLIEWQKVFKVRYFIQDSARIGNWSKPLVVLDVDQRLMAAVRNYTYTYQYPDKSGAQFRNSPDTLWYQADGRTTFVLDGHPYPLDAPGLNISWVVIGMESTVSSGLRQDWYTLSNDSQADLYSAEYILAHGACKPSDTYQWGFSYIFLFMVSIFNFVWSCIMVGMWYDTVRGSRMYKSGRRPGLLRSVLDIAGAIREELGGEAEYLEERELRTGLTASGGALVVPKKELRISRTDTGDGTLRKRSWRTVVTKGSTF